MVTQFHYEKNNSLPATKESLEKMAFKYTGCKDTLLAPPQHSSANLQETELIRTAFQRISEG